MTATNSSEQGGEGRMFPLMGYWDSTTRKEIPLRFIPWAMIAPHDKQAQDNHGRQTLERLAQRGGLSRCEAVAVLLDKEWKAIPTAEAEEILNRLIEDWNKK